MLSFFRNDSSFALQTQPLLSARGLLLKRPFSPGINKPFSRKTQFIRFRPLHTRGSKSDGHQQWG